MLDVVLSIVWRQGKGYYTETTRGAASYLGYVQGKVKIWYLVVVKLTV